MTRLGDTIGMALDDAARAEALMTSSRARRAFRDDPERMLDMFEFHRSAIEDAGVRSARAERRFLAVRASAGLRQAGSAL